MDGVSRVDTGKAALRSSLTPNLADGGCLFFVDIAKSVGRSVADRSPLNSPGVHVVCRSLNSPPFGSDKSAGDIGEKIRR